MRMFTTVVGETESNDGARFARQTYGEVRCHRTITHQHLLTSECVAEGYWREEEWHRG